MNNLRTWKSMAARISVICFGVGAAAFLAHCGKAAPVLHIYTWADYFKPALVARFEKENSCRVIIDTYDSNETMYAKIRAGATGYDLLTPTSYMVSLMNSQGMVQKLDHALLPNLVHVDPEYLMLAIDKTMDHSVPYMIVNTVIAYLGSRVKDFEPSWAMFDRSDLKGRMTMLNDMRETIGAGLKFLGYSINSTDEAELVEANTRPVSPRGNSSSSRATAETSSRSNKKTRMFVLPSLERGRRFQSTTWPFRRAPSRSGLLTPLSTSSMIRRWLRKT
jgi:spermidine/putrescine-binding protein